MKQASAEKPHQQISLSDGSGSDLLRFPVPEGEVAHRVITQKLRELILSKVLLPGTRLPTLAHLAEMWGTNYFTVQSALTPLVNEGLLARKQRTGTFVTGNQLMIRAVGIYMGSSFWGVKHAAFYQTLHAALSSHFEQQGITVHLFMDTRPREAQGTPLKPLIAAIQRREVHGVIGAMLTPAESDWLTRLAVPVSLFGNCGAPEFCVSSPMDNFLRSSLRRLKARGCGTVALLAASALPGFKSFAALAAKEGLETRPEWICRKEGWPEDFEDFGFESFKAIWSGPARPDGLIVYPDNIALGVIMAILQHGVQVPEELQLVFHCNEEIYFHCPLPADWQVVSIQRIVENLWKHLLHQAEGRKPRSLRVPFVLQPASPEFPPILRKWISQEASDSPTGK